MRAGNDNVNDVTISCMRSLAGTWIQCLLSRSVGLADTNKILIIEANLTSDIFCWSFLLHAPLSPQTDASGQQNCALLPVLLLLERSSQPCDRQEERKTQTSTA